MFRLASRPAAPIQKWFKKRQKPGSSWGATVPPALGKFKKMKSNDATKPALSPMPSCSRRVIICDRECVKGAHAEHRDDRSERAAEGAIAWPADQVRDERGEQGRGGHDRDSAPFGQCRGGESERGDGQEPAH